MTFDTLAVATELKQAGFPPEQAEALARAWSHVAESDLATKTDLIRLEATLEGKISGLRSELKDDISSLRSELKDDISSLRSELKEEIGSVGSEVKTLRWMIGFALGLLVLILGKLFVLHP